MALRGFFKSVPLTIPVNETFPVGVNGKGIIKNIDILISGSDVQTQYTNIKINIDGVDILNERQYHFYAPCIPLDTTKLPVHTSDFDLIEYDTINQEYRFVWHANLPYNSSFTITFIPPADVSGVYVLVNIQGIEEV